MGKSAEQSPQVLCDICRQRPAALQVTVSQAGRRRTLNVCQTDYLRLRARSASVALGDLLSEQSEQILQQAAATGRNSVRENFAARSVP